MKNWKRIIVNPELSVIETMRVIDINSTRFVIVADKDFKLLGTVTDGDIRRALLGGHALEDNLYKVMNSNPVSLIDTSTEDKILNKIREKSIQHLPLVNENGEITNVISLSELSETYRRDNPVVIMAGGLGSRLGDLTKDCPKPLLKVKGKPILEHIIEGCKAHGLKNFFISVNYLSEQIEDYFGDGSKWNIEITYLKEEKKLGTAGALSLLSRELEKLSGEKSKLRELPVLVMNGDLLTKVNFTDLLDHHEVEENNATLCVRDYEIKVPYGVIETQNGQIQEIQEKPIHNYFINAGIYVLGPSALKSVPYGVKYHMTDLFQDLINGEKRAGVFPIREYWLDVGRIQDLEHARSNFQDSI